MVYFDLVDQALTNLSAAQVVFEAEMLKGELVKVQSCSKKERADFVRRFEKIQREIRVLKNSKLEKHYVERFDVLKMFIAERLKLLKPKRFKNFFDKAAVMATPGMVWQQTDDAPRCIAHP